MKNTGKKIYIGAAWPYANGSLHLGHVSSLIGADILARYFRLSGADVLYTSGSDCHGTPIVLAAEQENIKPEEVAKKYHQEFLETLVGGLDFSYDNYTTTTTETHIKIVQEFFLKLYQQGDIYLKTQELPFCISCDRFLPDRYIEGECPKCHYKQARGDQCDECGTMLDPRDLINPKCKQCGEKPEFRETEHFFLKLSGFQEKLIEWSKDQPLWRTNAVGFTKKLLKEGLHDRAITRDTKWGIPIPIEGYDDKSIYVWFEAVSGYFTSSVEWAKNTNQPDAWREFWENDKAIHYYVHGKDNIPFHTIIWPSILMGYGELNLPNAIISSEYLTLEHKQFSKSRHWAVWLPDFLKSYGPDTLRYYLTVNGCETSDADFSWHEYQQRTNKELIGNFSNFIYRTAQLIEKNFDGEVVNDFEPDSRQIALIELVISSFETTAQLIETGKFREAIREIFNLAEAGNKFLAETEPWKTIKDDKETARKDLVTVAQVISSLATLISPFLPRTSENIRDYFEANTDKVWQFEKINSLKIHDSKPIFKRIEDDQVTAEVAKLGK